MNREILVDYTDLPWGTPGDLAGMNRLSLRAEHLFVQNRERIEGKRVLDLACNNGRLSYPAFAVGAREVVGLEARPELIEQADKYFSETEFAGRTDIHQGDLFAFLENSEPGEFDVICCFGFLYHTVRQVDFFRLCKTLQPETIIIDTSVAKNYFWYGRRYFGKPPMLLLADFEDPKETRNTTDLDGIAFWPTPRFLEAMFDRIGYRWRRIEYKKSSFSDWSGMDDYRKGHRASYIAYR